MYDHTLCLQIIQSDIRLQIGDWRRYFIFLVQVRLKTKYYAPKFDPAGVQTHDLQIMTVDFMSLRRLF